MQFMAAALGGVSLPMGAALGGITDSFVANLAVLVPVVIGIGAVSMIWVAIERQISQ